MLLNELDEVVFPPNTTDYYEDRCYYIEAPFSIADYDESVHAVCQDLPLPFSKIALFLVERTESSEDLDIAAAIDGSATSCGHL